MNCDKQRFLESAPYRYGIVFMRANRSTVFTRQNAQKFRAVHANVERA
jgi:hypothetical protein